MRSLRPQTPAAHGGGTLPYVPAELEYPRLPPGYLPGPL